MTFLSEISSLQILSPVSITQLYVIKELNHSSTMKEYKWRPTCYMSKYLWVIKQAKSVNMQYAFLP